MKPLCFSLILGTLVWTMTSCSDDTNTSPEQDRDASPGNASSDAGSTSGRNDAGGSAVPQDSGVAGGDLAQKDLASADGFAPDAGVQMTLEVALEQSAQAPKVDATYYVRMGGTDTDDRDGTSPEAAWASIAYAGQRVPKGAHVIDVGPGRFEEQGPITLAQGVRLKGAGSSGPARTLVVPPDDWDHRDGSPEAKNGYLIQILRHDDVTVESMAFENNAAGGAKAAIYVEDTDRTRLRDLHVQGFNLAGIVANRSRHTEIAHSTFVDTAGLTGRGVTVALDREDRSALGAITLIFVKPALIHHNDIYESRQTGIKGYGIEATSLLYANHVRGAKFGLETPHKSDSGLRVFNNVFDHWISVPKNGTYGPRATGVQHPHPRQRDQHPCRRHRGPQILP